MAESDEESVTELGDYQLGRVVSEGERTVVYEAEQISVRRKVLVERVRPEEEGNEAVVEAFLADVRAKAALDYPVISSVYEAVRGDEGVYFAREKPPGRSLAEMREEGERLAPRQVLLLLERLGETAVYLSEHGVRTEALRAEDIYFEEPDVLRLDNRAESGSVNMSVKRMDREMISEVLGGLLAEGRPGTTRTGRLLELLGGEDPPNWPSVAHTAGKLARELAEGSDTEAEQAVNPGVSTSLVALVAMMILVAAAAVTGAYFLGKRGSSGVRALGQMVEVKGGKAFGEDGEEVPLPVYWIDAHEVTVAEYGEFLSALAVLPNDQRGAYDHVDQPGSKEGHVPDDWETLEAAIERGDPWKGLVVGPNCPVVNVDWWDAYAYANWRGGRLPTQAEWFAAAENSTPQGSGWGPVDVSEVDRTPGGVHGLAGNVTEWVEDTAVNPAFPMNKKTPMSCGASYLQPSSGSMVRIWHPGKGTRRADLGIRVVRDRAP